MLIDHTKDIPEFTAQAKLVPEFLAISKLNNKDITRKRYKMCMLYLYFIYDKLSPYNEVSITERKKMVDTDYIIRMDLPLLEKMEDDKLLLAAIPKFRMLTYTVKEKMIDRWKNKVDQIQEVWELAPCSTIPEATVASQLLKKIDELLTMKERIDKMSDDVKEAEFYGGGTPGLFELDTNIDQFKR